MMLRTALGRLNLALYLHRVRTPGNGLSIAPDTLDEVLQALAPLRGITISFDDGYQDAVDYVRTRAPKYPHMQFLMNVCPGKLDKRAGFRWDIGDDPARAPNIDGENDRAELAAVGGSLTTVAELKSLPDNVSLGNHSNCHLPIAGLSPEQAERELRESTEDFHRLFGQRSEDFAFPFGVPGVHFHMQHVQLLRTLGYKRIWCTKESPYAGGDLLPRVHLLGEWTAPQMLRWILRKVLVYRLRSITRSPGDFPL